MNGKGDWLSFIFGVLTGILIGVAIGSTCTRHDMALALARGHAQLVTNQTYTLQLKEIQ